MFNALACVPGNVQPSAIGDLFGVVCGLGQGVCDGIKANATTGEYGAYGMCNPQQQLGWAMNAYYQQQNNAGNGASACDFSGAAKTQAAASPSGNCNALISQAGSNGQGTVTSAPTATGGSGSGSTSKGAAPSFSAPSSFGWLQAGAYLVVAFVSGAGMIAL